jgi:hypothetical protein
MLLCADTLFSESDPARPFPNSGAMPFVEEDKIWSRRTAKNLLQMGFPVSIQ